MSQPLATVATVLEPAIRNRLDSLMGGRLVLLHRESLTDALRAVRARTVYALLVSPRMVREDQLGAVSSLANRFPGVETIAVVSEHDAAASANLLGLGASGVRRLVDVSARNGWQELRSLVSEHTTPPVAALILGAIVPAMGDVPPDCRYVFDVLARQAPRLPTVRTLAAELRVRSNTFMSRFCRAGLPSPKRYLSATRLVHASALLEVQGLSVSDVAYRLEYSSPQSFGRHVRALLGVTAGEFRRQYPFRVTLEDYVTRLVVPFRTALSTFHPLDNWVAETGHR